MSTQFYVYEHWRPDRGECFYVGKGKGSRANAMKQRNAHHKAIQAKLARLGLAVEVRIVEGGLSEADAFELERQRIALWRADGADLTNMTDGGEGFTGGRHDENVRRRMSASRSGRNTPEYVKEKISSKLKGRKYSPETIKRMSEAQRVRMKNSDHMRKMTEALVKKSMEKKNERS